MELTPFVGIEQTARDSTTGGGKINPFPTPT